MKLAAARATALAVLVGTAGLLGCSSDGGDAGSAIRVAYVDPLSGGGATIGEHGARHFQWMADHVNAEGGVLGGRRLEIVLFDNKGNPQEGLIQVQKAIDAGIRIIAQGNGSSVAAAISDFVHKHNRRNPGREVLYLNYSAVDPVLTNEKCGFWHFRFDAHSDIKMGALTSFIARQPGIRKVYLINEDYSFGHAVRAAARAMLREKRPDVVIVGDEVHALQRITDFAPYVAKIQASGADSVITGNWGNDISLLLKAAAEAGLQARWFTYYAGGAGGPTAIRQAGIENRVFQITEWHNNILPAPRMEDFVREFDAVHGQDWWYLRVRNTVELLCRAIEEAGSTEPLLIAMKLRTLRIETAIGGEAFFRPDDHQLFQDMYISSFGPGVPNDAEDTGWGWKTVARIPAEETLLPTTCRMEIPGAETPAGAGLRRAAPAPGEREAEEREAPARRETSGATLELALVSVLNSLLYSMLLFLLASGLTLIFSMMGVLNFAHASFYMLGAYFGFQLSAHMGFWPALVLAPLLAGLLGAAVERYGLRTVHRHGHVAELLFTFGLAFIIEEAVQMIWGKLPVDYRVPASLDFSAFTLFQTTYPAYRMFILLISVAVFLVLLLALTRTRIGLIIRASLTHPNMVAMLGHDVPRVFILVFGAGCALAALAGAIAGPVLVTQPSMAMQLGPILFVVVVFGGLGSLTGAFIASLVIGFVQTFAVSINYSLADFLELFGVYLATDVFLADLWHATLAQVGPILPYLLLVLILIFRPTGLMGRRET